MTRREFLLLSVAIGVAPYWFSSDWEKWLKQALQWRSKPMGELVGHIGIMLVGVPYKANSLDVPGPEECVVDTAGFDCVTFVEFCLALALMIKSGGTELADLVRQIERIRYRSGIRDGYTSRLHYTKEWISDNVHKKVIRNVTPDLPSAELFVKEINFMTTHKEKYRQLVQTPVLVREMQSIEKQLTKLKMEYVPKGRVGECMLSMRTGDLIALTSTVEGLDFAHVGLCVRDDQDVPRFLHASSLGGQIELGSNVSTFMSSKKSVNGFVLTRPLWGGSTIG